MVDKKKYVEYLISTPFNYTSTHMADHQEQISHDMVNRFLSRENFQPADLWTLVQAYLNDQTDSFLLVNDSVRTKK